MSDDIDLHGLTPVQARQYTLQFVATMKELENKRRELKRTFETWERRVRLAKEHGRSELQQEAMRRLQDISERYQTLGREKRELEVKVKLLKERLRALERQPQRTVNAEALLAELERVVGPDRQLKEDISRIETGDELDSLRRKMEKEEE